MKLLLMVGLLFFSLVNVVEADCNGDLGAAAGFLPSTSHSLVKGSAHENRSGLLALQDVAKDVKLHPNLYSGYRAQSESRIFSFFNRLNSVRRGGATEANLAEVTLIRGSDPVAELLTLKGIAAKDLSSTKKEIHLDCMDTGYRNLDSSYLVANVLLNRLSEIVTARTQSYGVVTALERYKLVAYILSSTPYFSALKVRSPTRFERVTNSINDQLARPPHSRKPFLEVLAEWKEKTSRQ